jgi:predicted nucleic acid-binding protein
MERNIDFIDGYIVAVMDRHKVTEIFSYDKKHQTRIASIKRKEP